MARAKIGLQSLTASKEAATVVAAPASSATGDTPARRGRPPKRPLDANGKAVVFGQTIRMTPSLRRALRAAADLETDQAGAVVSVHDIILEAVHRYLVAKGIQVEE